MAESLVDWASGDHNDAFEEGSLDDLDGPLAAEPPHPINWNLLSADGAEAEWIELNRWVNWLRRTYGLPASVVPPFWHRHPELVWELSALHLYWLGAYDPDQHGSAPFGWHRDFADARQRLRDWVAISGTRLERDRPNWANSAMVSFAETLISAARLSSAVPSGKSSAKKLRLRAALLRLLMRSNGTDAERIVLPSPKVSMAFFSVTKSKVRRSVPTRCPTSSP